MKRTEQKKRNRVNSGDVRASLKNNKVTGQAAGWPANWRELGTRELEQLLESDS